MAVNSLLFAKDKALFEAAYSSSRERLKIKQEFKPLNLQSMGAPQVYNKVQT